MLAPDDTVADDANVIVTTAALAPKAKLWLVVVIELPEAVMKLVPLSAPTIDTP